MAKQDREEVLDNHGMTPVEQDAIEATIIMQSSMKRSEQTIHT